MIDCQGWFDAIRRAGVTVYVPEIADYELRRELLRAGQTASVARLDNLREGTHYLPITTRAMKLAAAFWANARNQGRPTAPDLSLDADMILAAQAVALGASDLVVATSNPCHLNRYVPALLWRQIMTEADDTT